MRCRSPDSIRKVWCSDSLVTKSLGCVCAGDAPRTGQDRAADTDGASVSAAWHFLYRSETSTRPSSVTVTIATSIAFSRPSSVRRRSPNRMCPSR